MPYKPAILEYLPFKGNEEAPTYIVDGYPFWTKPIEPLELGAAPNLFQMQFLTLKSTPDQVIAWFRTYLHDQFMQSFNDLKKRMADPEEHPIYVSI